jgi:hypothetical protein
MTNRKRTDNILTNRKSRDNIMINRKRIDNILTNRKRTNQFFFCLCLVSRVTYVSRLGTSFFFFGLCLVSRVTYVSRLGTSFFVFGLFLVSRVTYVSRLGTSLLSSVCVLCPELHMSLDWEPFFFSGHKTQTKKLVPNLETYVTLDTRHRPKTKCSSQINRHM